MRWLEWYWCLCNMSPEDYANSFCATYYSGPPSSSENYKTVVRNWKHTVLVGKCVHLSVGIKSTSLLTVHNVPPLTVGLSSFLPCVFSLRQNHLNPQHRLFYFNSPSVCSAAARTGHGAFGPRSTDTDRRTDGWAEEDGVHTWHTLHLHTHDYCAPLPGSLKSCCEVSPVDSNLSD